MSFFACSWRLDNKRYFFANFWPEKHQKNFFLKENDKNLKCEEYNNINRFFWYIALFDYNFCMDKCRVKRVKETWCHWHCHALSEIEEQCIRNKSYFIVMHWWHKCIRTLCIMFAVHCIKIWRADSVWCSKDTFGFRALYTIGNRNYYSYFRLYRKQEIFSLLAREYNDFEK